MGGEYPSQRREYLTQSCTGDLPFLLPLMCDLHLEARKTERRKDKWKDKEKGLHVSPLPNILTGIK